MAALAGEYRESHTIVAFAAVLATHDGFHADLIAAPVLAERGWMTVGTIQPFGVLGVRELYPGHVSGFAHHYVVETASHRAFG